MLDGKGELEPSAHSGAVSATSLLVFGIEANTGQEFIDLRTYISQLRRKLQVFNGIEIWIKVEIESGISDGLRRHDSAFDWC